MSGTAAVIVSWNGRPWLERHWAGWQAQREPFARTIVVDNGSTDGTDRWLASCAGAESVRLPRNLGFAAGTNAGIRAALRNEDTDAVALINNDVSLDPDWNRAARAALFSAPDIGACATCLLQSRDPGRIDSAGIVWPRPGWADNALHGEPARAAVAGDIAGVSAGAGLYRARFLRDVGGFDERLFAYQEDVDLSIRGHRAGWRYRLAPDALGLHAGHGSNRPFPLGGSWADYFNARNRVYVLFKSGPGPGWERHGASAWVGMLGAAARSPFERRGGAVWAGLLHGLLRWPAARRARREGAALLSSGLPAAGAAG